MTTLGHRRRPARKMNPLKEGLSSKILLAFYEEPAIPFAAAKSVYMDKKVHANKVYEYIANKLHPKYVDKIHDTYRTRSEPIIEEFVIILRARDMELTEYEHKIMIALLESNTFRKSLLRDQAAIEIIKSNGNLISSLAAALASDSTRVLVGRRLGSLEDLPKFKSEYHHFQWFKSQFELFKKGSFERKIAEQEKSQYEDVIKEKMNVLQDLFPEINNADLSYGAMKVWYENTMTSLFCLNLLRPEMLQKLMKLDENAAKRAAVSSVLAEKGKLPL